jgi:Lar family restriction alleviation protein
METPELKPCPFCGCEVIKRYRNGNSHYLYCDDCGASTNSFSVMTSKEKVDRKWNTRTIKNKTQNSLYVVTMYRWGNRENHSYVLGMYDDENTAKQEAEKEIVNRDNKYFPEILQIPINKTKGERKIIVGLQDYNG